MTHWKIWCSRGEVRPAEFRPAEFYEGDGAQITRGGAPFPARELATLAPGLSFEFSLEDNTKNLPAIQYLQQSITSRKPFDLEITDSMPGGQTHRVSKIEAITVKNKIIGRLKWHDITLKRG